MTKKLIIGNEAIIQGTLATGAQMMTGYPITPASEILQHWSEAVVKNPKLKLIQAEDEMSAGFMMLGGVLAGLKAFTATAGPGNVLMQDAFSMAENMRLPTVAFINQRGGPSTGTVIYSQQELNLTCFGGNGEGLRIVYSCSNVQEMYDYAIKAFNTAWKYRFPTFVLSDGYLGKTMTEIDVYTTEEKKIEIINPTDYLLDENKEPGKYVNLRNTYNLEYELHDLIIKHKKALDQITPEVIEYFDYHTLDAEIVIFAHGIVAASAKQAVDILREQGIKVGLFRPITLNPFPKENANDVCNKKRNLLVIESSLGQFEKLLKSNLYGKTVPIKTLLKPAMAITSEEIVDKVKELLKENK